MESCRSDLSLRCDNNDTGSWSEIYWGWLLTWPRQRFYEFLPPNLRAMELSKSMVLQLGGGLVQQKTAESVLAPFFEVRVSEMLLVNIPA